jgi:Secretion system C-terminal sorting domain
MKKIYFLFVAFMISQHVFAQTCTPLSASPGNVNIYWSGAVSTDWNTACNWSPAWVPDATNAEVVIDLKTNQPTITGIVPTIPILYINLNAKLTVKTGGTLNITGSPTSIRMQGEGSSIVNDGTIKLGSGSSLGINVVSAASINPSITNRGTITTNNVYGVACQGTSKLTFINESTGVLNGTFGTLGTSSINLTNRGTINNSGGDYAINFNEFSSVVNDGTINITSGSGIAHLSGSSFANNACGKVLMSSGNYNNGGTTTNVGLIQVTNSLTNTGTFTNNGVLKYGTLRGTVTNNQNSSVIVRNLTYPIFTYGGTFNGTINGIFTDSLATVSAGLFAAPFAFTPLATLPRGIQTLYVKITPSGGACSYIVPFSYNTLTSSVLKVDAQILALQQNRPNPFSQETTISFTLPETNKAVLTVFDITGREVFSVNKGFKTGYNEVILNKSVFQNTGTYFYRLTTDKYVAVKRLQFVAE